MNSRQSVIVVASSRAYGGKISLMAGNGRTQVQRLNKDGLLPETGYCNIICFSIFSLHRCAVLAGLMFNASTRLLRAAGWPCSGNLGFVLSLLLTRRWCARMAAAGHSRRSSWPPQAHPDTQNRSPYGHPHLAFSALNSAMSPPRSLFFSSFSSSALTSLSIILTFSRAKLLHVNKLKPSTGAPPYFAI